MPETVSSERNNMQKAVMKFVSRLVGGLLVSVFLGTYLDDCLGTRPICLLVLMIYVIVGSLYALVKEAGKEKDGNSRTKKLS